MRNFLWRALPGVLLFLAVLAPGPADAKWVTKEIRWNKTSQGSPSNATAIYTRDTTYNVVAAGQTDTTGTFTLNEAEVWRRHDGAATTVDTCFVAYLVLQSDSSGVDASTLTSVTYEIDGRAAGFQGNTALGNWAQVDSTVTKFVNTPATNVHAIPIRAISGLGSGSDAENNINFFYRIMAYEQLRVRITAAAGVLSASRAFIRYWTRD